jgi:DNA-directed RNA polymerase subunit RPC12/RpoP
MAEGGRRFTAQGRNTPFVCVVCGTQVPPLAGGGCRNHCPHCLHSLHVDVMPGDRASDCGGVLEPIAVDFDGKKGWVIVHRCQRCGAERRNKAALDDPSMPDSLEAIMRLAAGDPFP